MHGYSMRPSCGIISGRLGATGMGLKQWIARNTSNPSQYANAYATGLMELIGHLAASFVAFSGSQSTSEIPKGQQVIFENSFEMELSGFKPVYVTSLIAPNVDEMAKEGLFATAYRDVVAFLCLCSEHAARKYMKPQNAEQFSHALQVSIATRCAGHYGFDSEPRDTFMTFQKLIPLFLCNKLLNTETFGKEDGLSKILNHMSLSPDGQIRYAFVVGSNKRPVGCVSAYAEVITNIDDNIGRCARDLRW